MALTKKINVRKALKKYYNNFSRGSSLFEGKLH